MKIFRCSALGRLMTDAVSIDESLVTPDVAEILKKRKRTEEESAIVSQLKQQTLSVGAKSYIRELAAQDIFGVDFEISSKQIEKGIEVELESIELLNRVHGLNLVKNTERKTNDFITGEADLFDTDARRGHDIKSSWSVATFPISATDGEDKLYEWQMRGYMALWEADEWQVNYCLVDTPERLISYEPLQLHMVSHIPEAMRVTTVTVRRDAEKEAAIYEKVKAARAYYAQVIEEFDRSHMGQIIKFPQPVPQPVPQPALIADDGRTIRLGEICSRLGHGLTMTADFLASLGFNPVAHNKAAKLYRESDFPLICAALVRHINQASVTRKAA